MYEQMIRDTQEALLAEISQRSDELEPDYYYNDIGPLLYVFAAVAEAGDGPPAALTV